MMNADQLKHFQHLKDLSDKYYTTGQPDVTDEEFDQLVSEYEAKFNTKFTYLGSASNHHPKVKLPIYMGSLNKCKTADSILNFASPRIRKLTVNKFIYTEKLDGISMLLEAHRTVSGYHTIFQYTKLYTRGDGVYGSDVSHLLTHLIQNKQLPPPQKLFTVSSQQSISYVDKLYVRGELVIANKHKAELGANLRNIVCGVVNSKTLDTDVLSKCDFVAYNLYTTHSTLIPSTLVLSNQLKTLEYARFHVPLMVELPDCTIDDCNQVYDQFLKESKYPIDGVVIAKDIYQPIEPGQNPTDTIAFKRMNTFTETTVTNVKWETSRYGTLHPIVEIVPVDIDGCTIQCASGFNAKYILDNKVGPGAIIQITRSGEVIPHILQVVQSAREAQMPTQEYEWQGVHAKLTTSNLVQDENMCISRLVHSMKVLEAKGISEAIITKLYKAGFTDEWKLFGATVDQIMFVEGFKAKSASNVVSALSLAQTRVSILNVFLMSSYFAGFGEKLLRSIFDVVDVVRLLTNPIQDDVSTQLKSQLATVSVATRADTFIKGLKQLQDSALFMKLLQPFLTSQSNSQSEPKKTEYTVRAVFSGLRPSTKLKASCECKGIKYDDDTVTKQTTCLVVKQSDKPTTKVTTAIKLGVSVITIDQFVAQYQLEN